MAGVTSLYPDATLLLLMKFQLEGKWIHRLSPGSVKF